VLSSFGHFLGFAFSCTEGIYGSGLPQSPWRRLGIEQSRHQHPLRVWRRPCDTSGGASRFVQHISTDLER
jgi:hypothetical protein